MRVVFDESIWIAFSLEIIKNILDFLNKIDIMIESYFHIKKKEEMDYLISYIFCQFLNFITRKQVLFYILNQELIWGFGLFSRIDLIGCLI